MAVIASKKIIELAQADDPKQWLIDAVDVSRFRTFGDNVTVATFIRPERTKGGIYRPESAIKEDEFQGNVGLVVKVGEGFAGDEEAKDLLHQWVRFGYTAGLRWRFGDIAVRDIPIGQIRGTVEDPNEVL